MVAGGVGHGELPAVSRVASQQSRPRVWLGRWERVGSSWGVFVRRVGSEHPIEGDWCDVRGERRVLGRVLQRRADGSILARGVAALDAGCPRPVETLRLTGDPLERGAVALPDWSPTGQPSRI